MILRYALLPFLFGIKEGGATATTAGGGGGGGSSSLADHDAKNIRDDIRESIISPNKVTGTNDANKKKEIDLIEPKHLNSHQIKLMETKKELQSIHLSTTLRNQDPDVDGITASFNDAKEDADATTSESSSSASRKLHIVDSGLLQRRDSRNLGNGLGWFLEDYRGDVADCASICGNDRPVVTARDDVEFQYLIEDCLEGSSDCGEFLDTPIGCWDVSRITDMTYAFGFLDTFNEPLECWDVSRVTKMEFMFYYAEKFNQPIGNWDVSNVSGDYDMYNMMDGAVDFNQDLNGWNVSRVKDMHALFYGCIKFNTPLKDWDVAKVEYMSSMFGKTYAFNQGIDDWNVSGVLSMKEMFSGAEAFDQDLNSWIVNRVKDMSRMFSNALDFNECLSSWASKTPNDVSLDRIFNRTSCPYSREPDPSQGPWCQGPEQGCIAPVVTPSPTSPPSPTPDTVCENDGKENKKFKIIVKKNKTKKYTCDKIKQKKYCKKKLASGKSKVESKCKKSCLKVCQETPPTPGVCKDDGGPKKKYTVLVGKKKKKGTCAKIAEKNYCNKKLDSSEKKKTAVKQKCKKTCGVCQ